MEDESAPGLLGVRLSCCAVGTPGRAGEEAAVPAGGPALRGSPPLPGESTDAPGSRLRRWSKSLMSPLWGDFEPDLERGVGDRNRDAAGIDLSALEALRRSRAPPKEKSASSYVGWPSNSASNSVLASASRLAARSLYSIRSLR